MGGSQNRREPAEHIEEMLNTEPTRCRRYRSTWPPGTRTQTLHVHRRLRRSSKSTQSMQVVGARRIQCHQTSGRKTVSSAMLWGERWGKCRWCALPQTAEHIPLQAIVDSRRYFWRRIKENANRGRRTIHGIRRRRREWISQRMDVFMHKHDVCATATLSTTEAKRVKAHEVRHIA